MKKFLITLIILGGLAYLGFTFVYPMFFNEIGEDEWHILVLNEYLNVRQTPSVDSTQIDTIYKDEKYRAVEVNTEDDKYYWYKIELDNGKVGWTANTKDELYLTDYNNPHDIKTPEIKFFTPELSVNTIDDITYDHLEVIDDSDDYTINHVVLHEATKNQYWIRYTVEDKGGNKIEKTQRILFKTNPSADLVQPF